MVNQMLETPSVGEDRYRNAAREKESVREREREKERETERFIYNVK